MTDDGLATDLAAAIDDRLTALKELTRLRRERQASYRATRSAERTAGLRARHANKIARINQQGEQHMAGETIVTICGNLVEDPGLRFTPSGVAVTNFRIASTPRIYNKTTSGWEDGEALFLTCNVWKQPAENVAETLQKGMRVILQGRLKQRSYETKTGEKRTVFEVDVDEIGPSLRSATAKVTKTARDKPAASFGGGQPSQPPADQWSTQADDNPPF